TPNPADDTVTFLAVRHHLEDSELRAALDRGAEAAGHPLRWREQRGRPVAVRAAPGADARIIVLPQPGLAIMTPPAYATLLLDAPTPDAGTRDWRALVERIDAEDSALPEDAVFMITASNLLRLAGVGAVSPGSLAIPEVLSLTISIP